MQERVIAVCGTNWLGDCVMSMPAIQMLKRRCNPCRLVMLAKDRVADIWRLHPDIDETIVIKRGYGGTKAAAAALQKTHASEVYVFPNSFRSALIPFMAGVPRRIGMRGHCRSWMLTDLVRFEPEPGRIHQAWEYIDLVGAGGECTAIERPALAVSAALRSSVLAELGIDSANRLIGLIPGAARGPAKRWPTERFAEVGRRVAADGLGRIVVLGSPGERDLCAEVTDGIGQGSLNLAGKTGIGELAAVLSACATVVTNDSGGMHLAAACGVRVVAIFGLTNPATTGPLGEGHVIISAEGVPKSRDIARNSHEAAAALATINADMVLGGVCKSLRR